MSPSRSSRIFALLMLGSVVCGVFAPGAVALTRDDIRAASERNDIASDVRDFFTKALEDAMVRTALVGPVSSGAAPVMRRGGLDNPEFVMAQGTLELATGPSIQPVRRALAPDPGPSATPTHRSGPLLPRAP